MLGYPACAQGRRALTRARMLLLRTIYSSKAKGANCIIGAKSICTADVCYQEGNRSHYQ